MRRIGLSIVPSSASWVRPAALPYAFTAWYAPSTFSLVEVVAVGQDRRDAGAQAVALGQRAVAHEHARHVHDRVQRSGREAAYRIAELTDAFPHGFGA